MRGEPVAGVPGGVPVGITPAYAGRTAGVQGFVTSVTDHPRVCGENSSACSMPIDVRGSPPRMRGEQPIHHRGDNVVRITPAYAGRTLRDVPQRCAGEDHPRVCGENPGWCLRLMPRLGSPPRMRGEHLIIRETTQAVGITPAYAGRTLCCVVRLGCSGDHPRVCGENPARIWPPISPQGSPPRMRGEPRARPRSRSTVQDHPRVCGENRSAQPSSGTS